MSIKKVLILNSHSLDSFQQCNFAYYNASVKNLVLKTDKRKGIKKGTIWHKMMQMRNEGIENRIKEIITAKEIYKWFSESKEAKSLETEERLLLIRRFTEYATKYPTSSNEKIIAIEKGFTKEMYRDDYVIILYEGKIDLLIQLKDSTLVWKDYKTQHPAFTRNLHCDSNQFLGYTWAVGNSHGIVDYTTFSKTITDRTFRRVPHSFSPIKIEAWNKLTLIWAFKMLDAHIRDNFLQNFSACDGKYGLCRFLPICNVPEAMRERVEKNEFIQIEPYKSW